MSFHAPLNLVTDPWLPVRRQSGVVLRITPPALTDGIDSGDPIIAFAWSRPDFDAAARELVIGLLATACPDRLGARAWLDWWRRPPTPEELAERLASLAPSFELDGQGPRFMQDLDPLADGSESDVAALLIDSPGGQTLEQNRDLFVKRRRVTVLGRSAAAMALYTLNAFAPAGGAGIRTSLRGGGPFSCMVVPSLADEPQPSLWRVLWLNVETPPREAGERLDSRFPWCLPTRASKLPGTETTATDVDPLQAFWAMPRRTRLLFEPNTDQTPCDLTGAVEPVIVKRYRSRPYGNNYKGWSRAHPLTPYRRAKASDSEWLAQHPQPGRLAYKDWVGLVVADAEDGRSALKAPAAVVASANARLRDARAAAPARLVAAGYDMDNMKPRGFVESVMPLVALEADQAQAAAALARRLVAGAEAALQLLSGCIRQALAADAHDKGEVQQAKDRFWAETEQRFFDLLAKAAATAETEEGPTALAQDWCRHLAWRARAIFDDACPLDPEAPRGIEAVVAARRRLGLGLNGYGKEGNAFFTALLLPSPEPGRKAQKGRKRGT